MSIEASCLGGFFYDFYLKLITQEIFLTNSQTNLST
jgi:hypothetical protein